MELRDPGRLTTVTKTMLWLWLLLDLAVSTSALFTIDVQGGLGGDVAPADRLTLADRITRLVGIGYALAFAAAAITVLRWTYVTNRNAHAVSDWPLVSPGGAVGWYFVPFAGLYKPFQAMRESWQASMNPANPAAVPVPSVMRWWWGAWIILSLVGNVTFRLSLDAKTPIRIIVSHWGALVSTPFDIVATVALTIVITRLSDAQRALIVTGGTVDV